MQKDFIAKPRFIDESFSTGNWHEAKIMEYRPASKYGLVRVGKSKLIFHFTDRVSPRIERVRKTLDVVLRVDGKDHHPIAGEIQSIFLRLNDQDKISAWFTRQDYVRGHAELRSAYAAACEQHQQLPNYVIAVESGERDTRMLLETNRPSSAIREWDKGSRTCMQGERPAAVVDFLNKSEVIFSREHLIAYAEALPLPLCIL